MARFGVALTNKKATKLHIRPKAPYFAKKWQFCWDLVWKCRDLHYLLKAIYRDLSEVENDEKWGDARLGENSFVGGHENMVVSEIEHLTGTGASG